MNTRQFFCVIEFACIVGSLYFANSINIHRVASKKKNKVIGADAEQVKDKPIESSTVAPQTIVQDEFTNIGKLGPILAIAIILGIAVFVFRDFLLGEKIYYFKDISSDSYNFSYPVLYNIADYIHQYGLPKWSFRVGMGQNIFPFFLRDPFDIILFIVGKDAISHGLVWIELFKVVLSGFIFFKFLKMLSLTDYVAIIGSILFAFSGFMIEGSGWYLFSFEAFNLALLLLASEQVIQKGNSYLFTVGIFLIGISMPFNLYLYGIFIAFYVLLRSAETHQLKLLPVLKTYGVMIALGVIGLLIAGPFLLENIFQLLESPRVGGSNSLSQTLMAQPLFSRAQNDELGTAILRFFSNDILGSGMSFKGWKNILEAPMFYCGLLTLVLAPQIFPILDKKVRTFFIAFIGIWLLPILFPYLRFAFWLFTGDYYRAYSFFVGLILLYYALLALDHITKYRKLNIPLLIGTAIFLLILLNIHLFGEDVVDTSIQGLVAVLIVIYSGILYMLASPKSSVKIKYALLSLLCIEVLYLSNITVNQREAVLASELEDRVGYNDYTIDAVKQLQNQDKSFFRIDKSYYSSLAVFTSLNDAQVQGYYGTSSYNPFNQLYFVNYLQLMKVSDRNNENDSRWSKGLGFRPILEVENRVKYILAKKNFNPFWSIMCDTVGMKGDVLILRNKYVLPFGYVYRKAMLQAEYDALSEPQKDFNSLRLCVLKDKELPLTGIQMISGNDTLKDLSIDSFRQYISVLGSDSLHQLKINDQHIEGKISMNAPGIMYLSLPYDDGWKLMVDGKETPKLLLNAGMTGIYLPIGNHQITLDYDLRFWSKGILMTVFGLILFVVIVVLYYKKSQSITAKDQ